MAEPIKNIVLVGRTGNGKSATGNTLLGEKMFESKKQAVSVTMECKMYRAAIQDGPIINVIDTPGLSDSAVYEDISKEIINCLTMAEEGIHAVLFVLSAKNRITPEEEATLNALQRIFDSKILDYCIVVFTGGDELEKDNQTLDDFFRAGCPEFLTKALRLCGKRKVLFNNITTDESKKADQLKQLLTHITDVGKQTGGVPYTYQMHHKIKEENDEKLRERERVIESKNRAEAEQAAKHEKLRRDKEMIALAETTEKLMEQQKAIESKNLEAAELVVLREKLRMKEEKLRMEKEKVKQLTAQAEEKRRNEKQMKERKKRWIVYARDLNIAWSDNISYWSWVPLRYGNTSSESLVEAVVLKRVCWLEVNGKFNTIELTPETKYEVVYVVKLEDSASGWEIPVNLKLTLPNSRERPQERSLSLKEHIGKQWVDITAGEFMTSSENAGDISFAMYETEHGSWKAGLSVKGVEIRPKN